MAVGEWDPDALGPGYMYVHVADHLAARIEAGEIPPDARLPGERELAAEYMVALHTVRHAVAVLRDRGLLVTFAAKGTYVVRRG